MTLKTLDAGAAAAISDAQSRWTADWHEPEAHGTGAEAGVLHLVAEQHRRNFDLWHEEDKARAPDVSDATMAAVKRRIDRLNQERNDFMERVEEEVIRELAASGVEAAQDAKWNSEGPGAIVDRLSILALKVFHMREQEERVDAAPDHRAKCGEKRRVLERQRHDLTTALQWLLDELKSGERTLRIYRQFKMYNDPSLNPEIYRRQGAAK